MKLGGGGSVINGATSSSFTEGKKYFEKVLTKDSSVRKEITLGIQKLPKTLPNIGCSNAIGYEKRSIDENSDHAPTPLT